MKWNRWINRVDLSGETINRGTPKIDVFIIIYLEASEKRFRKD